MSSTGSRRSSETGTDDHPSDPGFGDVLEGTIRDTLFDVFGKKSARTILKTMENVHSLKLEEVLEKGPQFRIALQDILGTSHRLVEDLISENVSRRLGQRLDFTQNYTSAENINAQRSFDNVTSSKF